MEKQRQYNNTNQSSKLPSSILNNGAKRSIELESTKTGNPFSVHPELSQSTNINLLQGKQVKSKINLNHVLSPCKCKMHCAEKLPSDVRHKIYDAFQHYKSDEQKLFFKDHVEEVTPKVRRVIQNPKKLRGFSRIYTLPMGEAKLPICKTMFLKTLGLKTSSKIELFLRTLKAMPDKAHPTTN
jgi:hypothetical protein